MSRPPQKRAGSSMALLMGATQPAAAEAEPVPAPASAPAPAEPAAEAASTPPAAPQPAQQPATGPAEAPVVPQAPAAPPAAGQAPASGRTTATVSLVPKLGRPRKHRGETITQVVVRGPDGEVQREVGYGWLRVNVTFSGEIAPLNQLVDGINAAATAAGRKSVVTRSDLVRSFTRAVLASGVDLSAANSEDLIEERLVALLKAGLAAEAQRKT